MGNIRGCHNQEIQQNLRERMKFLQQEKNVKIYSIFDKRRISQPHISQFMNGHRNLSRYNLDYVLRKITEYEAKTLNDD